MRSKQKQFLVLGIGRFGSSLAKNLYKLGHEVLAVDRDENLVDGIAPYVTQAVQADATDEAALEALGVRNYDAAIVATGNVRDSILISVLCKEAGVPCVITKAVDELHAKVLRKVGVDRVVYPERDMGLRVAKSLVSPNFLEMIELNSEYALVELVCPNAWLNRTLVDINIRRNWGVSVIGIRRGEEFLVSPGADMKLLAGDVLLILGKQSDIDKINEK